MSLKKSSRIKFPGKIALKNSPEKLLWKEFPGKSSLDSVRRKTFPGKTSLERVRRKNFSRKSLPEIFPWKNLP
jgi:hypothetical protein